MVDPRAPLSVEVLVATVGQTDLRIVEEMNLRTAARILNQADGAGLIYEERSTGAIEMLTLPDRGVGLNRNLGLMRSSADICIIADDDIRYDDDYEQTVLQAFNSHPTADLIAFNLTSLNPARPIRQVKKAKRLNRWTALRFGAARIAVRREAVLHANIYFSLLFGGGARYLSGEDTLFLRDCVKKGLRIVSVPVSIGTVRQDSSSWFSDYDERYFHDRGVLYSHLAPHASALLALVFMLRHPHLAQSGISWRTAMKLLLDGCRDGRRPCQT